MNKLYSVVVDETLFQTATYTIWASSPEEAKRKAAIGDTDLKETDPYSIEVASRKVRSVEEEE